MSKMGKGWEGERRDRAFRNTIRVRVWVRVVSMDVCTMQFSIHTLLSQKLARQVLTHRLSMCVRLYVSGWVLVLVLVW